MKYDDASWHCGGEGFPEESPNEYGGTHIALFLKWCFSKGWIGDLHQEEEPEDVARVISGAMSATDFLFKYCDGKLTDEDLSDEGNRFASLHYGENGSYLTDYGNLFSEEMYACSEADHDYALFSSILDRHLSVETAHKPWWKFWLERNYRGRTQGQQSPQTHHCPIPSPPLPFHHETCP